MPTSPLPRPATYSFVPTAAITDSSSTIGIADSNLYAETPAQIDQSLAMMQAIGVQDIRVFVPWAFVEPVQGVYNWTQVDAIVNAAAARGMGVLAEVNA
ncbi:MAG TPA: beta-galactosidase, partial [Mycobacterium sp.]|nr:beta-galactosidase [Mycobacterium sp.]